MAESTTSFDGVDFFTDTSIIDDPYPYYDFLREARGPVWIEPVYGVAVVTGHAESMEVYRDPQLYSSCNSPTGPFPGLPVTPDGDDASPVVDQYRDQLPMSEFMVTMDPPQHGEYRKLLTGLFTPKRLKENEAFMWRLADEQLDRFVANGRCEFVSEYAGPYAGLVIADLLGVPEEDMRRFREGFEAAASFVVEENPSSVQGNPLEFIESTFHEYIEDRRGQPRSDILTHLAQVKFSDGREPDVATLAREAAFVFAAGQETTVRLHGLRPVLSRRASRGPGQVARRPGAHPGLRRRNAAHGEPDQESFPADPAQDEVGWRRSAGRHYRHAAARGREP